MVRTLIKHRNVASKYLHGRIIWQFAILIVIFFLLLIFLLLDAFTGVINPLWLIGGLLIGAAVGYLAARMFKIKWKDEKIVSSMDKMGVVVLVLYVAFSVSKTWLFGHWLNGAALTSFSFSIVAGIMIGRVISMTSVIEKLLREKNVI